MFAVIILNKNRVRKNIFVFVSLMNISSVLAKRMNLVA